MSETIGPAEFAERFLAGPRAKTRPSKEKLAAEAAQNAARSATANDPYRDVFAPAIAEANADPETFAAAHFSRDIREVKEARRKLSQGRAAEQRKRQATARPPWEQIIETVKAMDSDEREAISETALYRSLSKPNRDKLVRLAQQVEDEHAQAEFAQLTPPAPLYDLDDFEVEEYEPAIVGEDPDGDVGELNNWLDQDEYDDDGDFLIEAGDDDYDEDAA